MENENLIAIIGMSGRFPKADSIDELWKNLLDNKECLERFSDEELKKSGVSEEDIESGDYVGVKGVIDSPTEFDSEFFGYTARESMIIDPQARVLLEETWKAIEDSGNLVSDFEGRVGVYAGAGMNTYILRAIMKGVAGQYDDFDIMLGSDKDLLATRVAYKLNLTGPSLTVQSTCSSSLVAVHLACQGLLSGDCDMAVAGGVSLAFPTEQGYKYRKGMIFSKSGHCRPFEEHSDGTIFSDGVGVIVLKRLEDAMEDKDDIYGVIRATAVNNDGNSKVGFTAPSPVGQAQVIRDCMELADVSADEIRYVETHGTATEIGDLLEVKAISNVYEDYTDKKGFCALGSVKSNIGHLNTASGISGLIKALLVLKNGVIPAMPDFGKENEALKLDLTPFYINKKNEKIEKDGNTKVAVSSFGIGGTNAHVIMQEPPKREEAAGKKDEKYIFPFSAKSSNSLFEGMENIADWLENSDVTDIGKVAATLQRGRENFGMRSALVAGSKEELIAGLRASAEGKRFVKASSKPVYFLITGQGSQYIDMAKDLYENVDHIRNIIDEGIGYIRDNYGEDLHKILYPSEEEKESAKEIINNTEFAQPLIFMVAYALGSYLMSCGVEPDKIIGHSLGEYVGACLAGVMSFEDGIDIVYHRGKILQSAQRSRMLAVKLGLDEVRKLGLEGVYVSTVNAPEAVVLGGTFENIDRAKEILDSKKIMSQVLSTSHAFHTPIMAEAAEKFKEYLEKFELKDPEIEIISNTTGEPAESGQLSKAEYWREHIVNPVLFAKGIRHLLDGKDAIFVELGCGKTLINLTKQQNDGRDHVYVDLLPGKYHKQSHYDYFLEKTALLWECGAVSKCEFDNSGRFNKIHMPTYRFDRKNYSLLDLAGEEVRADSSKAVKIETGINRESVEAQLVEPRDEVEELLLNLLKENTGVGNIGVLDNFYEIGFSSLSASQYAMMIKDAIQLDVEIREIIEAGNIAALSEIVTGKLLEDAG